MSAAQRKTAKKSSLETGSMGQFVEAKASVLVEKLRQFMISEHESFMGWMGEAATAINKTGQNVQGLSHAVTSLDSLLGTLFRILVVRQNSIITLQNRIFELCMTQVPKHMRPPDMESHFIPLITVEEIAQTSSLFNTLRSREDWPSVACAWYTGKPVDLPSSGTPVPEAEGAEIFGGDYVGTNGDITEGVVGERKEAEAAKQDEVP